MTFPDPRCQWRRFSIISDQVSICRQQALSALNGQDAIWVGRTAAKGVEALPPEKIGELLGQDIAHLVFDAHEGFDADAFAIAAGLVRGGGRFLLLAPPLSAWRGTPHGRFVQRLAGFCGDYRTAGMDTLAAPAGQDQTAFATAEQLQVIELLWHVVHGHSKRPLVVTADRGRGKSAAFGMAAAKLLAEGDKSLLVTAPRMNATLALFRHARLALPEAGKHQGRLDYADSRLQFIAPDELLNTLPPCDLLLVDEAAGIPLPLLEKLLLHYKRIAFATTVHGYEGSGRGFVLRFAKALERIRPQRKRFIMREPVRWAAGDPLEKFVFQTLLLDAEPVSLPETMRVKLDELVVAPLPRDELIEDEALLRHVFGLLVSAHYRTTPTDLQHLLDAPDLSLWVGWLGELPVAAMLVSTEGPLPPVLHEQIMQGRRRPTGQLLPLALATQCGQREALSLSCERVVRIAVHPALQCRGIGSGMLQTLLGSAPERNVDLLGSSFGATPELVDFWRKNHFRTVRLGYRREASSGAHSVLMLHGVTPVAKAVQEQAARQFIAQFPLQLAEVFSELEPALVRALFKGTVNRRLSAADRQSLQAFANGGRQYLDCLGALYGLALLQLGTGGGDADILVLKLLQKRRWREVANVMGLAGKKAAQERLRQQVRLFLES